MAFSYVNKNSAVGKAVTLAGVTAGNLIVCMLQWQDNTTVPTLSDGTNSPDGYSTPVNNGDIQLSRFAYWLSSPKSGSVTYTWTASGGGHTTHVIEHSFAGTCANDNINSPGTGVSDAAASGNITTIGTNEVVFGGAGWYNIITQTSPLIAGSAADQITLAIDSSYKATGSLWSRVGTVSNGNAALSSSSGSTTWVCDIISFKEAGVVFDQEGFRFRNDDGSETTATWAADQDTNLTGPLSTNLRLRIIPKGS